MSGVRGRFCQLSKLRWKPRYIIGVKGLWRRTTQRYVKTATVTMARADTIVSLRNRTAGSRGRRTACTWRKWQGYNLRVLSWSWLTSMFSGLLQKDLFKRKGSLTKSYFKQNYCHPCHTRFAVFFPLPSCCRRGHDFLLNTWNERFWNSDY